MAGPALTAHVFVACRSVQWDGPPGPHTTRTLEQVHYTYHTDQPSGFPYETDIWLFVRLVHRRRREFSRELYVSLRWHDDPQYRPELWTRRYQVATFRPDVAVRDVAFPVPLVFEGAGTYQFRLWYPVRRAWDGATRRRVLADTYIRIEG
ncbi:MAG TPA: hypothetical protein VD866_20590 [Urbifossiella sp.]|nr:hypothetical protein [Urbifossiella sp.]